MKGILVGTALAIAALSVVSFPALARLTGTGRQVFVINGLKSCIDELHKRQPATSAKAVETYCSCMAEAEADMITDDDFKYWLTHDEPPKDYEVRLRRTLVPACNRKAGVQVVD